MGRLKGLLCRGSWETHPSRLPGLFWLEGQVFVADLRQTAPADDAEPGGLLARRAVGVGPLAIGGHAASIPSGGELTLACHKALGMNRLFLFPGENEGCLTCCIVDL
jgi:hypothetical protein